MYKTLLIFDSYELFEEIKSLHIWGLSSEFEIEDVCDNGLEAYRKMREKRYDLVITEIRLVGLDGLQLLRKARGEGLCSHIVLCSRFPDFNYARQGIILGAFDYCVMPFEESQFISIFSRIKNENPVDEAQKLSYTHDIAELFAARDQNIFKYVSNIFDSIYSEKGNLLEADKRARRVCISIVDEIFSRYEWLDLYMTPESLYGFGGIRENDEETYKRKYRDIICDFFSEVCRLFPLTDSPKLQKIILHILENPESDVRLKSIANRFYINSSYLSTVFAAGTGTRFVDYTTMIKLKRAAFLLKETDMRILDIAERLDYKDFGYFSKIFKKEYGMNPSEYRQPDDYDYQI